MAKLEIHLFEPATISLQDLEEEFHQSMMDGQLKIKDIKRFANNLLRDIEGMED